MEQLGKETDKALGGQTVEGKASTALRHYPHTKASVWMNTSQPPTCTPPNTLPSGDYGFVLPRLWQSLP